MTTPSAIIKPMDIVVPDEFKYLYVQNAERPVVKVPADCLRTTCAAVAKVNKKTQDLIDVMKAAMRQANGIGLAAPQMGVLQRVIVIAPKGDRMIPLINPVVVEADGEAVGEEGCLSIPGLYGEVTRPAKVLVKALDRKGKQIAYEMEGMAARVVQHEIDHLEGVLFIDKVDAATLRWQHPDGEPIA